MIRTAREVNDGKPGWVIDKVRTAVADLHGRRADALRVVCLGLAFKPNIDDLRESPALAICEQLVDMPGIEVIAVEPHIDTLPDRLAGRVRLEDLATALQTADIALLLVDHAVFQGAQVHLAAGAQVIDTRGLWTGIDALPGKEG